MYKRNEKKIYDPNFFGENSSKLQEKVKVCEGKNT